MNERKKKKKKGKENSMMIFSYEAEWKIMKGKYNDNRMMLLQVYGKRLTVLLPIVPAGTIVRTRWRCGRRGGGSYAEPLSTQSA